MFLTAVDMTDADDSVSLADSTPTGVTVRAWYGVKLVSYGSHHALFVAQYGLQCARRLLKEPRLLTLSASQTPAPENVNLVDELATERLRIAYSSVGKKGEIAQGRDELFAWAATS